MPKATRATTPESFAIFVANELLQKRYHKSQKYNDFILVILKIPKNY